MTPRQILSEILRDYRYNISMGMPREQSLEVLKAMLVDAIEYEKSKSFELGVKSGRFAERSERQFGIRK